MKLNVSKTAAIGVALLVTDACASSQFGISSNRGYAKIGNVAASKQQRSLKSSWAAVPRGGSEGAPIPVSTTSDVSTPSAAGDMVVSAVKGLTSYMEGPKADTLLLLLTTALNTPFCKMLGTSPILGFLALGVLFGPNGFALIKDIHTTESEFS